MPLVFADQRGVVRVLPVEATGCGIRPARGASLDPGVSFEAHAAVLTRAQVSAAVNYQLNPAVGGLVHVTDFGNRPGQAVLQGYQFEPPGGGGTSYRWYTANRMSSSLLPVKVTFWGDVLEGLLVDYKADTGDPADGFGTWTATLSLNPLG